MSLSNYPSTAGGERRNNTVVISLHHEHMQNTNSTDSHEQCLVLQVVPPRTASSRDMAAAENPRQGVAGDTHHPGDFEIGRTERGRQVLVRATSRAALEHLAAEIHARYPQASI